MPIIHPQWVLIRYVNSSLIRLGNVTITLRRGTMFDQSYQQLYGQKQAISLSESYPCPRCKEGGLELFGETETFSCSSCSRKFVAINAGRTLYPAEHLKIKIAPIFWWDGSHWHWAGLQPHHLRTC